METKWTSPQLLRFCLPIFLTMSAGCLEPTLLGDPSPLVAEDPSLVNDAYSVNEDASLSWSASQGVLANDLNVSGGAWKVDLVSNVSHGTLELSTDGSISYTPMSQFSGEDSFSYRVTDGSRVSSVAVATITVGAVNDSPVSVADSFSLSEDATLTVAAAQGLLANDTDVEGDALSAVLVTNVGHGSLTLNSDGSLTYVPVANYSGTDSFSYRASDGAGDSNIVTVNLTIVPDIELTLVSPAASATGVLVNSAVDFQMSEEMSSASMTIQAANGACSGHVQLSADGFSNCVGATLSSLGSNQWRIAPAASLVDGTSYQVRITSGAVGVGGTAVSSSLTSGAFITQLYCEATSITSVNTSKICVTTEYSAASSYSVQLGATGDGSPATPFNRISNAITAAASGGVIYIGPGKYSGALTTTVPVTLQGAGGLSATDYSANTVLVGAGGATVGIHAAGGVDATHRVVINDLVISGFGTGIRAKSFNTIKDVLLSNQTSHNISLGASGLTGATTETVSDVLIDTVVSTLTSATAYGIRAENRVFLSNITIQGSSFTAGQYGIYLTNATSSPAVTADNITITGNVFQNQLQKAIYLERFSNSIITNCQFTNVATDTTYDFNNIIDLNLKYGTFTNVTISNSTFTGGPVAMTGTADIRRAAAIAIKARGGGTDTGYNVSGQPGATLSGVTLSQLTFTSIPNNAIRVGESGKSNPGPTAVTIQNNSLGATHYGLINDSTANVTATQNYWGAADGACVPSGAEVSAASVPSFSCAGGSARVISLTNGASTIDVSSPLTSAP